MGNGAGVEAGAAAGAAGADGADLSKMPAPEGMVRVRPPKDAKLLKQQFASIFGASEMKKLVERFTEIVSDRNNGNAEASKLYVEPTISLRAFLQQPEFSCSALAPLVAAGVLRENNVFEKVKSDVAAAIEAAADDGSEQSFGDDGGPMLAEFYCEFGEGKLGLVIKENKTKGYSIIADTKEGSQARNFEQIEKGVRITEVDGTRFPPKGGKKKDIMGKIKAASRPLRIGFAIPKKNAGQKEAVRKYDGKNADQSPTKKTIKFDVGGKIVALDESNDKWTYGRVFGDPNSAVGYFPPDAVKDYGGGAGGVEEKEAEGNDREAKTGDEERKEGEEQKEAASAEQKTAEEKEDTGEAEEGQEDQEEEEEEEEEVHSVDLDARMTAEHFCIVTAAFSIKQTKEEKLRILFNSFDQNLDGKLSEDDLLFGFESIFSASNLGDAAVQDIVFSTYDTAIAMEKKAGRLQTDEETEQFQIEMSHFERLIDEYSFSESMTIMY